MTETPTEWPLKIFLASLTCNALFAVMNMFVKLVAEDGYPVFEIMFFRNALALVPVVAMIMYAGGPKLFKTANPKGHLLRSVVGTTAMVFSFGALYFLPMGNAMALFSTAPLLQTLLSIPLLREVVGPHRIGAVIIGLCAVIFMLQPSASVSLTGSIMALLAALFSALVMLIIRSLGRTEHHLTIVFYFTLFSSIISGIIMLFFWTPPSPQALLYMIMAGLLGGTAQIFLTYAYARAPTAFVSAFSYSSIVFSALLDWIVWNHVIDWRVAAGSVIIILSGLYILYRETLKRKYLTPEAVTLNE